jgi:predicted methyltransferase
MPARVTTPLVALGLLFALGARAGGEPVAGYVSAAVADAARPREQVERDAWRKPAELLAFAGVKPGDRVADFMPGNAYFTRLFSPLVGSRGRVYAFLPAEQVAHCAPTEIAGTRALTGNPHYANVQVLTAAAEQFAVAEPLDLVWTAQDYHDLHDQFMRPTDVARFNAAVFRALKPGGAFLVIDHAAQPGSGLRDTETLHRIDRDSIVREVTAAGFVLEAESDVLRNPADSHALRVFDPSIRGRTDQVVLRFRKPLSPAPQP